MPGAGTGGPSIGVDTGGTFTDIYSSWGTIWKVPSVRQDPAAAILQGLASLDIEPGFSLAHGTTVATNAVLERKGARTALITTAGFEDVIEIRRQNRPQIYDLFASWPDPLVPAELRFGARERLDFAGAIVMPLTDRHARRLAGSVEATGVQSVAVCLLFAYVNSAHEEILMRVMLDRLGGAFPLSLSSDVAPQYGEYERTSTTVVNAYVMPVVRSYLDTLQRQIQRYRPQQLFVMQSNGGLMSAAAISRRPVHSILSGPAAGTIGAREVARSAGYRQIVTFDMGGTSTDVCVVPDELLVQEEGEINTFPLLIPMLALETVGAGGGSIAQVNAGGALRVGPESAGADPGPAAYGKGTFPTVSDANLVLGRISPGGLLDGAVPLNVDRARAAISSLADPLQLTVEQAAWAVVRLVVSNMERAVRAVTLRRGFDPRDFCLVAFGGAGPLHAADLAQGLGMRQVLVPPHPGVMAAMGLTVPPLQRDYAATLLASIEAISADDLVRARSALVARAEAELRSETIVGFGDPQFETLVDMRYAGQSFHLRVPFSDS
ncbi:MAG TPA: hydantoinase/oxoprolinase family protein, partial [Chloroflexota bacterium]